MSFLRKNQEKTIFFEFSAQKIWNYKKYALSLHPQKERTPCSSYDGPAEMAQLVEQRIRNA